VGSIRYRKILHLDLDAFFCAVEELNDPSLAGKAFAVGGRADHRGVISSCSYPARKMGVHSAMPTGQALKICPELILISGKYGEYSQKSDAVMEILHHKSGLVEQVSIDEAFIDVTDLSEEPERIAREIQENVLKVTGLPCSIGAATCKLVAKIATDQGKARSRTGSYPRAILVVPPGAEAAFLAPLKTSAMWGVGPKFEKFLANAGIYTIGEIAARDPKELEILFGKIGRELHFHAMGIDNRPLTLERDAKSISQETTFSKDTSDPEKLRQTLRDLSAKIAYRMRQEDVCARVIRLKIRWSDFSTHTRQERLENPTDQDGVIFTIAEKLWRNIWTEGRPVRLIGVGGSDLVDTTHQMSLWDSSNEKERNLLKALDELNERYGKQTVRRASKIKKVR
jgi:DNA polymerase-4